ncbi:hypothetical protein L0B53_01765 [Vibrio sp. SS-MA-C1-2]|uniref:O-antigen ligase family protein n=1 Tax=Vibrio sp. SS-MA-C1-2 TaxID=2908646 RepID=UPI001F178428|nr:hypothetical protein [Vibrio sp. SS-MA-C1-2]UJF17522.1 hypothetical protein L0B53_01765 [Vibrio sp. SS-MA-C1-2]
MNKKVNFISISLFITLSILCLFSFNIWVFKTDIKLLYDYKRVFVLCTISVFMLVIGIQTITRTEIVNRLLSLPKQVILFSTIFILSILHANYNSHYFEQSQTIMFFWLGLIMMAFALSTLDKTLKIIIYPFFPILSYLLFASVLIGFLSAVFNQKIPSIHHIISFVNPRFLNQIQIWLVIPLFYLLLTIKGRKKWFFFAFVPLILNISLYFGLDARGVSLSTVSTLFLWTLLDRVYRKKILFNLTLLFALGFIIKTLLLSPMPNYIFGGEVADVIHAIRTNTSDRISLWQDAINISSLIGHGGKAYICNYKLAGHPHNSILNMLFNYGLIATLCYMSLALLLLKTVIVTKFRQVRVTGLSLIAGLTYSLFSGVLVMPLSQLMFALSLAIYIATYFHYYSLQPRELKPVIKKWMSLLLILSSTITILNIGNESYKRIENNFHQSGNMGVPEFWLGQNCLGEVRYLRDGSVNIK